MDFDLNPFYTTTYPNEIYKNEKSNFYSLYSDRKKLEQGDWIDEYKRKLSDSEFMTDLISELSYRSQSRSSYSQLGIDESVPFVFYDPWIISSEFIAKVLPLERKKLSLTIEENKFCKNFTATDSYEEGLKKFEYKRNEIKSEWDRLEYTHFNKKLVFKDQEEVKIIAQNYNREGYKDLKTIKEEQIEDLIFINRKLYFDVIANTKVNGEHKFDIMLYLLKWLIGGNFIYKEYSYELNRQVIEVLRSEDHYPYMGAIEKLSEIRLDGAQKYFRIKLLDHIIKRKKEGENIYWEGLLDDSIFSNSNEYYISLRTGDNKLDEQIKTFIKTNRFQHEKNAVRYFITSCELDEDSDLTIIHERARNRDVPPNVRDISYSTFYDWIKKWRKYLENQVV